MGKSKKMLTGILLLSFLMLMVFSGCGQTSNETVTQASTTAATVAATTVTQELPYAKLIFYLPGAPAKDDQLVHDELNKILKAKLNTELDIRVTDFGQWNQKKQLILSSGEPCDLMFSAAWDSYYQEVGRNSYLPIDDLLQKYGQDILKLSLDGYLQAPKVKGKAYGVATNKDSLNNGGFWLTQDTVTKLNLNKDALLKIKTLEDLEPLLAAIKQKMPEVTPIYVSANKGFNFNSYIGANKECADIGLRDQSKLIYFPADAIAYDIAKQETVALYNIPQYINQSKLLAKWMKLGYINSDVLTTQMESFDMAKNGKTALVAGYINPIQHSNVQTLSGVPIFDTPITLTEGVKGVDVLGAATCLPVQCSNPDRAMMVINESFINEELMQMWSFGIENTHYTKISDHVIKPTDQAANYIAPWWQFGNWYIGKAGLYTKEGDNPDKWNELKDFINKSPVSALLGFSLDTEPIKTELAAHSNVNSQYLMILTSGVGDPDDTAKKWREKDKAAGIDKILAEYDKQIKEFLATK